MQTLEPDVQLYIIERLAHFATPTQVQGEIVKQWDGLKPSLQAIAAYNPASLAGQRLSPEYKALFAHARDAFLADRDAIGLSHANYRRKRLQEIIDHPLHGQNPMLVRDIIELCEKVDGGMYRKEKQQDTGGAKGLEMLRAALAGMPLAEPEPAKNGE